MQLAEILALTAHGSDTWVGTGPQYPWSGLYGGQVVAQALVAAGRSVEAEYEVHSMRAYFIRRGAEAEPVRYEVERIRDGRTFVTRRVVARQNGTAILNLEASFQRGEASEDIETVPMDPSVPRPGNAAHDLSESWSPAFEREWVPDVPDSFGGGRAVAWLQATGHLSDDPVIHAAGCAFMSDDLPTDAVIRAHPIAAEAEEIRHEVLFTASLDHTIWFHRPVRCDEPNLHDFSCHSFVGGRGLALGHIYSASGEHVATVAQEVLIRDSRLRD
ncbi:MAG: acyl-CoA thioesterase [Microthrixaceae bacterium]